MSDILGELRRVQGAYEQPTLTLLHQRLAPVILAIFRSSFSRDVRTIPAARLHDHVEAYLDELRFDGATELPTGSGRDLCLRWMRGQWLVRSTEDDGTEVYTLTSHAQDALTLVKSLTRERASLSEHRIATILSAVRRFNTEVNPDRAARVQLLERDIARLTKERDELLDGKELEQPTPDYMLEGYSELLQLIAALPSDFARVEEAFNNLRGDILASFRAEDRAAGEVIDDYLKRADALMTATPEGRAFEGAFTLLRDDELLLQLREDLGALLGHPLADDILIDADRRELRGTVALIRAGLDEVLTERNRVTAALRDYIVTHDITRDRELDSVLRQLDGELNTWMATAGPRTTVPLPLLPSRVDVNHLRERFHDPETEAGPPPLADVTPDALDSVSLRELLMAGGPSLGPLRSAVDAALEDAGPDTSLGAVFDALPQQLRRPVEILGLLHLATNNDGLTTHPEHELYTAIRPDGSTRSLRVPRVAPQMSTDSHTLVANSGSEEPDDPTEDGR